MVYASYDVYCKNAVKGVIPALTDRFCTFLWSLI